jgi:hypothetical protein
MDVAEGTRPAPAHVQTCEICRRELADLRRTMAAVAEVAVPEPSPLFWDHLSARIREAVAETPQRWRLVDVLAWRALLPAGAIAIVVLAVVFGVSRSRAPEPVDAAVTRGVPGELDAPDGQLPSPDTAGDPSLELIADLSQGLDWDAATEAGWTTATGSLDQALDRLNDAERATLHQLLQDALSGKGA